MSSTKLVDLNPQVSYSHFNHQKEFNTYRKIFIRDHKNKFHLWLEALDSVLEDSKKPNLANPIYRYYFKNLGSLECLPLDKEKEERIAVELQDIIYELVTSNLDVAIPMILDSFDENGESKYTILSDHQKTIIQKSENKKRSVEDLLKSQKLFLRPISISKYFENRKGSNTSLLLSKTNELTKILQVSNLRLVIREAKRYQKRYLYDFFDIIQEGNLSLLSAIDRFDHRKGYKFSTYSTWWIKQAISRYLDNNSYTVRIPIHYISTVKKLNKSFIENNINFPLEEIRTSDLVNLSNLSGLDINYVNDLFTKAIWVEDINNHIDLLFESNSQLDQFEDISMVNALLKLTKLSL